MSDQIATPEQILNTIKDIFLAQAEITPRQLDEIRRAIDPEWHADWWHVSDIADRNPQLTEADAQAILNDIARNPNAELGINWDVIDEYIFQHLNR